MPRLYLFSDAGEITRRRKLVAPGRMVEAWPDLYTAGRQWVGETSWELLMGAGPPLSPVLAVDEAHVRIYYGPRVRDVESLPLEESLKARVLSAHGIAAAWITLDQAGERTVYEPTGPADPIFFLRRPAATAAHIWRLFRRRREARAYMTEYFGRDPESHDWTDAIGVESFEELLDRYAVRG